jgi:hypothetical protein
MNHHTLFFAQIQERDPRQAYSLVERWEDRIARERTGDYGEYRTGANCYGHADELSSYTYDLREADLQAEREHDLLQLEIAGRLKAEAQAEAELGDNATPEVGQSILRLSITTSDKGVA